MSRIGKQPITIPSGVTLSTDATGITVKGPKGELHAIIPSGISVTQNNDVITIARNDETWESKSTHGLMRALVQNMVIGVSNGFSKKLEVNGVGYRVSQAGKDVKLQLGYSHEVMYHLPDNITAVIDQNTITISGIDKQLVGQVAADIRELRKPEPYKGKGIKYSDERILRKSGKSGKE